MNQHNHFGGRVAALACLVALVTVPAHAQQTYFNSRTLFNAANPGLVTETLENSHNINIAGIGPVDDTTNNTIFSPGDILPGIRFQAVGTSGIPGSGFGDYFYNTTFGDGSKVWTTNDRPDSLDITFYNGGTKAAGLDLSRMDADGYTIRIFDTAGNLLDTQIVVPVSSSDFFGVSSIQPIGRLNIADPTYETVDNVSFKSIGETAPEPDSLALLGMAALPLIGMVRRRNA